jgi:hypothetical protein
MKNDDFIRALFRQLLNREADEPDVTDYVVLMSSGVERIDVIIGIMNTSEAKQIYFQPTSLAKERLPTVADKLQLLMAMNHEDMVHHFYVELLCRHPDPYGFNVFIELLKTGSSPLSLVNLFLKSKEWKQLIESDRYYFTRKILADFFCQL